MMTPKSTQRSSARGKKSFAAFAGVLAVFSQLGVAHASPEFPGELQEVAGMDCRPACTICHTTNPGARGTATQPFAFTMADLGLTAGDPSTVGPAFDALGETDSDKDGVTDVNELTAEGASDPSAAGVGNPCAAEIRYGCAAASPTPPADDSKVFLWPLLLSALGIALWGRRLGIAAAKKYDP